MNFFLFIYHINVLFFHLLAKKTKNNSTEEKRIETEIAGQNMMMNMTIHREPTTKMMKTIIRSNRDQLIAIGIETVVAMMILNMIDEIIEIESDQLIINDNMLMMMIDVRMMLTIVDHIRMAENINTIR